MDVHTISDLSTLISSAGALPLVMTYEEHDHVTAAISHLPHVISASLVNLVHDQDGPEHYMKLIAAGGFRDITRISSSSPQMWQEICLDNPDNICSMMDAYISKLIDYRLAIRNENAEELLNIFTQCKDYRDSFDTEPKGSLPGEHRIYVDIADEPGAIAQIATMLAMLRHRTQRFAPGRAQNLCGHRGRARCHCSNCYDAGYAQYLHQEHWYRSQS